MEGRLKPDSRPRRGYSLASFCLRRLGVLSCWSASTKSRASRIASVTSCTGRLCSSGSRVRSLCQAVARRSMIRSASVRYKVPLLTTLTETQAAVEAIHAMREGELTVKALQDYAAFAAVSGSKPAI